MPTSPARTVFSFATATTPTAPVFLQPGHTSLVFGDDNGAHRANVPKPDLHAGRPTRTSPSHASVLSLATTTGPPRPFRHSFGTLCLVFGDGNSALRALVPKPHPQAGQRHPITATLRRVFGDGNSTDLILLAKVQPPGR